jgi:hypothetical protein
VTARVGNALATRSTRCGNVHLVADIAGDRVLSYGHARAFTVELSRSEPTGTGDPAPAGHATTGG